MNYEYCPIYCSSQETEECACGEAFWFRETNMLTPSLGRVSLPDYLVIEGVFVLRK